MNNRVIEVAEFNSEAKYFQFNKHMDFILMEVTRLQTEFKFDPWGHFHRRMLFYRAIALFLYKHNVTFATSYTSQYLLK